MIKLVKFTKDYRCFAKGDTFTMRPGVNLIVGDQGCGKSTFLNQIAVHVGAKGTGGREDAVIVEVSATIRPAYFDFERHNPRTQPSFDCEYGYDTRFQLGALRSSHGEVANALIREYGKVPANACTLLDEPDAALSPRSAYALVERLKAMAASGAQVIAAVHNPILIQSQEWVLSLEHRRWMRCSEFMDLMRCSNVTAPVRVEEK